MSNSFNAGDLIATRGNTWLSRSIRFMMDIYCRKVLHKPCKVLFNHIAVVVSMFDELWVVEALGWGVRVYPIERSGYLTHRNLVILRDKRGFTQEGLKAMSKKVVALGGVRYQYENLPQWVIRIFVGIKKVFRSSNERSIYCSELGAIAINAVYPMTFKEPNIMSPMDHVLSPVYEVIDINGIMNS